MTESLSLICRGGERKAAATGQHQVPPAICPAKSSSHCHQNRRNFHVIFIVIPRQIKQKGIIAVCVPEQACFKNCLSLSLPSLFPTLDSQAGF